MKICQKVMSFFSRKRYTKEDNFPEEDECFEVKNPYFDRVHPGYAIREKRPFLNGKGYYSIYVINYVNDIE